MTDFFALWDARARATDPDTSHDAAKSISREEMRESQRALLQCIMGMRQGGTDESIAARYESHRALLGWPMQSPSGLRSRRKELVDLGYLRDSGRKETLPSGRHSIVWESA